jgi:antitoxin CptB
MSPAPSMADPELGRVLWRCRRGMKELDLLLERFARTQLGSATPAERRGFERLLSLPDPVLARYLLGGGRPQGPELTVLVKRIRAYVA